MNENEPIMLSALQHYLYCPRQCALIHVEQVWSENYHTASGRAMHEKVDTARGESRKDLRVEYGTPLRSLQHGLVGKADAVEFHRQQDGSWLPFPVEYKLGKKKVDNCDRVQLCSQALCLEEMLKVEIPEGALFYGKTRRREEVAFEKGLRAETVEVVRKTRELIESGQTPGEKYGKKCDACSLLEICLPASCGKARSAEKYLSDLLAKEEE